MTQKAYWEFQLNQRLSFLTERGVDAEKMATSKKRDAAKRLSESQKKAAALLDMP